MNKGKKHIQTYPNEKMCGRVYYHDIKDQIKSLGITQKKASETLGMSRNAMLNKIDKDAQILHWAIYGLSCYLGEKDG